MNPGNTSFTPSSTDSRVLLTLLGLYSFVIFPILRADQYYNDDLKRALVGHGSWDATGRPLTTLLMRMLQAYDPAMVDISPLTQMGAVLILAWTGVLIARRYVFASPWIAALAAFPLGAQPFFLENLSYKFDALSMSLAIFFALLPIVMLGQSRQRWWLGIASIFVSLDFYQAATNAYLVFVILDVLLGQLEGKTPRQLIRQFASRALQAGLAMLLYQLIIGVHINGWVRMHSEKIHSLQQLPLVASNFVDFYTYVAASFSEQWQLYFSPILLSMLALPAIVSVRYALRVDVATARIRVALFAAGLLTPLAALACALGPMLILEKPLFVPRVLIGFGALLAAGLILAQAALRQWRVSDKWALAVGGILALGMCVIASAYGNALREQKNYETRIAAHLADDLAGLKGDGIIDTFMLDGSAGYSPVTAHVASQFPIIYQLISPYLSAEDRFHSHAFLSYYVSGVTDMRVDESPANLLLISRMLAQTCTVPASYITGAYRVHVIVRTAVVTFSQAAPERCDVATAHP
ncbi:hypothetical protein DYGSA30_05260 [Dyella sp. GSA-30]|nr:hypothetical protein DYGSA30_05260 [Dyella sp. GSA-30]